MADSSGSTTSESFPASWTGLSVMDLSRLYEDLIRSIFTFLAETRIGFGIPRIKRRGYDGCSSNSI